MPKWSGCECARGGLKAIVTSAGLVGQLAKTRVWASHGQRHLSNNKNNVILESVHGTSTKYIHI